MSKHTPGPWTFKDGMVFYRHGFLMSPAIIKAKEKRLGGESWLDMRERTKPERERAEKEQIANALLIAAAPDLLKALELAREMFIANDLILPKTFEVIDEALTKARGSDG